MSKNIGNSTGPHLHFEGKPEVHESHDWTALTGTPIRAKLSGVAYPGSNINPGRSWGPHLQFGKDVILNPDPEQTPPWLKDNSEEGK